MSETHDGDPLQPHSTEQEHNPCERAFDTAWQLVQEYGIVVSVDADNWAEPTSDECRKVSFVTTRMIPIDGEEVFLLVTQAYKHEEEMVASEAGTFFLAYFDSNFEQQGVYTLTPDAIYNFEVTSGSPLIGEHDIDNDLDRALEELIQDDTTEPANTDIELFPVQCDAQGYAIIDLIGHAANDLEYDIVDALSDYGIELQFVELGLDPSYDESAHLN